MKKLALALLAVAALAGATARADHAAVSASIHIHTGAPAYVTPVHSSGYGYWRDHSFQVWVPGHWETRCDRWGRTIRIWEPGHYELRSRRDWVGHGGHGHQHRRDHGWNHGWNRGGHRGYDDHRDHDDHRRRGDRHRDHHYDRDHRR